jgi:hypothetical protein
MDLAAPAEASILYRSRYHFGIQLKNLAEMQRQLHIVKWHIMKNSTVLESRKLYHYRHSLDQKGKIGQGRKTSPCLTLERLEGSQAVDSLSALGQHGRQGLGFGRKKRKICSRAEIIDRLKKEMEEKRLVVLHKYEMQANWLSWGLDNMMQYDMSWKAILYQYSQRLVKFILNAQLTLCQPQIT